jgi:hypothetical protein
MDHILRYFIHSFVNLHTPPIAYCSSSILPTTLQAGLLRVLPSSHIPTEVLHAACNSRACIAFLFIMYFELIKEHNFCNSSRKISAAFIFSCVQKYRIVNYWYSKIFPVYAMRTYCGNLNMTPLILNLSTERNWVVSLSTRLLCLRYPLNRRVVGPQRWSGPCGQSLAPV